MAYRSELDRELTLKPFKVTGKDVVHLADHEPIEGVTFLICGTRIKHNLARADKSLPMCRKCLERLAKRGRYEWGCEPTPNDLKGRWYS